MNELVMMEAALFQLRAALENDPQALAIRISADVLGNAITAAKSGELNAARVNDIEFALNDVIAAVDDAGAPDDVYRAIALLQNDTAALRNATALPQETVNAIRSLQSKLRARAKAIERSHYRTEGTEPEPLPHPLHELHEEAVPLARQLNAAGFEMPALDALVASGEPLLLHTLTDAADELDVILGG
jgi:hypothetical protein